MRGVLFSSIAALALCGTPAWAGHGGGGHGGHSGHSGAATGTAATGAASTGAAAGGSASAAASGGAKGGPASNSAVGVANKGGSLQPGGGFENTQIPFGSTDTAVQGGPGQGGMGGSSMTVSPTGKKNWPCYPAGQWAGSADFHTPAGCK